MRSTTAGSNPVFVSDTVHRRGHGQRGPRDGQADSANVAIRFQEEHGDDDSASRADHLRLGQGAGHERWPRRRIRQPRKFISRCQFPFLPVSESGVRLAFTQRGAKGLLRTF